MEQEWHRLQISGHSTFFFIDADPTLKPVEFSKNFLLYNSKEIMTAAFPCLTPLRGEKE